MSDWKQFCRSEAFRVEGECVRVLFSSHRTQVVRVESVEGGYRLESTVMGDRAVKQHLKQGGSSAARNLGERLLLRNRGALLVGFKWTGQNRVLAESHVPSAGLTREEFRLHLLRVAQEADRLELLLTGMDRN